MKEYAVIIFTRFPSKNKVKTRLSKDIDTNLVLNIHKAMVLDTISVCKNDFSDILLFITEFEKLNEENKNFFAFEKNIFSQGDYPFGEKMNFAFKKAFEMGYKKVILIGTDIPTILKKDIETALKSLDYFDSCINKTFDKGYYLIGLKKLCKNLFDEKIFETESVFENTIKVLEKENLSYTSARILRDIDNKEDLDFFVKNEMNFSEYEKLKKLLKECYNE